MNKEPYVRESKTVLASEFQTMDSGNTGTEFWILCQWDLDSRFQLLMGFWIQDFGFHQPKSLGIQIFLHGAKQMEVDRSDVHTIRGTCNSDDNSS